jgi:hypothetical protein
MEILLCDFCRLNFPCHPFLTFPKGGRGAGLGSPFPRHARRSSVSLRVRQEKLEIEPMIFGVLTRNTAEAIELVPINTAFTLWCIL